MECQIFKLPILDGETCDSFQCAVLPTMYSLLYPYDASNGVVLPANLDGLRKFQTEIEFFQVYLKMLNKRSDGKYLSVQERAYMHLGIRFDLRPELISHACSVNDALCALEAKKPGVGELLHGTYSIGYALVELMQDMGYVANERVKEFVGFWAMTQEGDDIIADWKEDIARNAQGVKAYNPVLKVCDGGLNLDETVLEEARRLHAANMDLMAEYVPENIVQIRVAITELGLPPMQSCMRALRSVSSEKSK